MSRGEKNTLSLLTERNQNLPLLITITDCLGTILKMLLSLSREVRKQGLLVKIASPSLEERFWLKRNQQQANPDPC